MRRAEEIIKKIEEGGFDTDLFGFATGDLLAALSLEQAKPFLKDEYFTRPDPEGEWKAKMTDTEEKVLREMANYLPFAQEKINDQRGLSADRSCQHFIAWAWLIDDEFSQQLQDLYNYSYEPYGQSIVDAVYDYLKEKGVRLDA